MTNLFKFLFIAVLGLISVNSYATEETVEFSSIPVRTAGTLDARSLESITISGVVYNLAPGLVFYDFNNAFVPLSEAPVKWKKINYQLDLLGQVHKIWLLPLN